MHVNSSSASHYLAAAEPNSVCGQSSLVFSKRDWQPAIGLPVAPKWHELVWSYRIFPVVVQRAVFRCCKLFCIRFECGGRHDKLQCGPNGNGTTSDHVTIDE